MISIILKRSAGCTKSIKERKKQDKKIAEGKIKRQRKKL